MGGSSASLLKSDRTRPAWMRAFRFPPGAGTGLGLCALGLVLAGCRLRIDFGPRPEAGEVPTTAMGQLETEIARLESQLERAAVTSTAIPTSIAPRLESEEDFRIAFVSDREGNSEIYVMQADGTGLVRLTEDPGSDDHPAFSPDGRWIVFQSGRDGDLEIFKMKADGSELTRLTDNSWEDREPAFSPDGSEIVFVSHRDSLSGDLYVMDADGTDWDRLTEDEWEEVGPAFSPDGTQIAYQARRSPTDGIRILSRGSQSALLTPETIGDGRVAYHPGGQLLAFSSNRGGGGGINTISTGGGEPPVLTAGSSPYDSAPAFSPEGTQIVFMTELLPVDSPRGHALLSMDADGTRRRRLTGDGEDGRFPTTGPPSPEFELLWRPCEGYPRSRLNVGSRAVVAFVPELPSRIREEPSTTSGEVVGLVFAGMEVDVLEGPYCGEAYVWWKVDAPERNLTGWTVETHDDQFALIPLGTERLLHGETGVPVNPAPHFTLTAEIEGDARAVLVEDDIAYVSMGRHVEVFDVSDPAQPSLLGRSADLTWPGSSLERTGDYLIVVSAEGGGFATLDVSDPASPRVRGDYLHPEIVDLVVSDRRGYVASAQGPAGWLTVLDVTRPWLASVSADLDIGQAPSAIAADLDTAFILEGRSLTTIDIRDPENPVPLAAIDVPWAPVCIALGSQRAYVGVDQGSLSILDVREAWNPAVIGSTELPLSPAALELASSTTAIVVGSSGILHLDLSQLENPAVIASLDLPGGQGLAVSGSTAFVATGTHGLKILQLPRVTALPGGGPVQPNQTPMPSGVTPSEILPVFVYPVDGQVLDYVGDWLFAVEPLAAAEGYLWGFFQNGEMVWENWRDEGTLSGEDYGIPSASLAHGRIRPGELQVLVRGSIGGEWTDAAVIVVDLK